MNMNNIKNDNNIVHSSIIVQRAIILHSGLDVKHSLSQRGQAIYYLRHMGSLAQLQYRNGEIIKNFCSMSTHVESLHPNFSTSSFF